ncbi:MAG: phage tail protein [Acidimicrobiales bacterium]
MALPTFDAAVGWSFALEVDGIQIKEIQEVSGIKQEVDTIELKENTKDGKFVIKQLPGRRKAGEFSITRGLTDDKNLQNWIKDVWKGDMVKSRKNGAVKIFDFMGKVIHEYKFTNGWPKNVEIGTLKAGDTSVLTEKCTIVYEELELQS